MNMHNPAHPGELLTGWLDDLGVSVTAFAAMMARPRMILLDEPSEGIMPILVDEMFELFASMRKKGVTLLLVEQNVERALKISDRAYIVDQGQIVHHGNAGELLENTEIQEKYCAV